MNEKQKNPDMPFLTGQYWGQYHITGVIEQGRFSSAYLGVNIEHPSKQLVVEIFPMTLTADDNRIFLQSGHALMQLVHPSILRLFDVGVENTRPFIVLDSLPHTPLRQLYLRGQGQPLEKLLPYLRQVASALQYAHAQGCMHKQLCPDNVLLGQNNTVVLCDFSINGIDKNELFQSYQHDRLLIEPLTYIAPEQIQQRPVNASDQYALGTMIYEWLCGNPPFFGNSSEIAQQQLYRAPSGLRQKVPGIAPDIEEVVMMALVKEPGNRFANISAFVNALEYACASTKPGEPRKSSFSVRGGTTPSPITASVPAPPPITGPATPPLPQPIIVKPATIEILSNPPDAGRLLTPNALQPSSVSITPPPATRQQKPDNTTRRAFLISAAGIAIVGGIGSWLLWSRLHPAPNSSFGNSDNVTTSTSPGSPLVYRRHTARVNAVAWSPDGQKIASASDDKSVLICDRVGNTLLTYSGHQGYVNAVDWSPDGKLIASGSADTTVQVWDATSGQLAFTYTGHKAAVNTVAWAANNKLIASGSDDKTVQAWSATTGAQLLSYRGHAAAITSVAWSPDTVKIASGSFDQTLQVCSTINNQAFLIGDQIFSFTAHKAEVYGIAWSPDGTRIASAGGDHAVQVCSGIDGSDVGYLFRLHDKPVRCVAWSLDGKFILSGSDDKTARVWDATTGKLTFLFRQHSDSVLAVAWSPDSTLISSGSADTTVQVWKPA